MVIGGKEFNEIYDLAGIRILVDSLRDCYAALGAVHSLWKPVPGRFKDYVAMPKSNMYQSLHTTVVGPQGRPIEVQIRTKDMHRTAEFGIAAHWRYKEGQGGKKAKEAKEAADLAWLGPDARVAEGHGRPAGVHGGPEDRPVRRAGLLLHAEGRRDEPAGGGDARGLRATRSIPRSVTARSAAKVNGKLVPLDYELRTGDTVEILTSKAQGEGPSQDWLRFVKTPRARNKIRQWFSRERREDALEEGRDALQRLMRKQNVPLKRLATEEALGQLARRDEVPEPRGALRRVGEGHVSPQSVVARLTRSLQGTTEEDVTEVPLARPVRIDAADVDVSGVEVPGSADVWVRLARCCTPVPGDEILGFVTRGQGVSVHRTDCPNAKSLVAQPERLIDVSWRAGKPTSFVVAIQVEALDRTRLLSDVATVLSDHHVNILSATSAVGRDRTTTLRFTFELARHHAPGGAADGGQEGRERLRRVPRRARAEAVLLQRVSRASVTVRGERVAEIGPGLLLLVGVGRDDGFGEYDRLAREDLPTCACSRTSDGKMNRSLADVGGEVLVVPQFTLYGDVRRGRRPSWDAAAPPEVAEDRVEAFARALEARGARVRRGAFREHMEVELVNDGPVTLWIDSATL